MLAVVVAATAIAAATPASASDHHGEPPASRWSGRLEVVHIDGVDGVATEPHVVLQTPSGRVPVVGLGSDLPANGTPVTITGARRDGEIHATTMQAGATEPSEAAAPSEPTASAAATDTGGDVRRVAVLLVRPTSVAPATYGPPEVAEWTFGSPGSVAAYWTEVSLGRRTVTGDVFGWYDVAPGDRACEYHAWGDRADDAATSDGVDLGSYDHVVYAFPPTDQCPFRGAAEVPGRHIWVNGNADPSRWLGVLAHELAHNWGAHHASSSACRDHAGVAVSASPRCDTSEYGDPFDMMGGSDRHHPNAVHKGTIGLLDLADTRTAKNGEHALVPANSGGAGTKTLRVPFDRDDRNRARFLYVEYRQPHGFDDFDPAAPIANGVTLRVGTDYSAPSSTLLLDSTPATATMADAPLLAGHRFEDTYRGVSIEVVSVTAERAVVRVVSSGRRYNNGRCAGVYVPKRVVAGQPFKATVTITNTGNTTWTGGVEGMYALVGSFGSQTTGTVALPAGVSIVPGHSYSYRGTFTAQPSVSTSYHHWRPVQGNSAFGETCSMQVTTVEELNRPTSPSSLRTTSVSDAAVALEWSPATDDRAVASYEIQRRRLPDDSAFSVIGTSTSATFTDTDVEADRVYRYRVVAVDTSGNRSRPSTRLDVAVPDTTAPDRPAQVRASAITDRSVELDWSPSADNVATAGYDVYRESAGEPATLVGSVAGTAFADSGLRSATIYSYTVVARDRAGNRSVPSEPVSARTRACAGGLCI